MTMYLKESNRLFVIAISIAGCICRLYNMPSKSSYETHWTYKGHTMVQHYFMSCGLSNEEGKWISNEVT